ncbi:hypothetical protein H5410_001418 [Solanum commersonii]|uniref:Uncharacterized protein n=1 Tax=Solanum commersonii TaxID=4109 RepID=A0A9J6AYP1_SOLCO|nr:hypothetical protein H5410_001418 [Solanum commersonii]
MEYEPPIVNLQPLDIDHEGSSKQVKTIQQNLPRIHPTKMRNRVISGAIQVTPTIGEEIAHFNLAMLKESSYSTVPISNSRDGDLEKIANDSLDMRTHIRCEDPTGECPNTWSSNSQLTKNVYNYGRTNIPNNIILAKKSTKNNNATTDPAEKQPTQTKQKSVVILKHPLPNIPHSIVTKLRGQEAHKNEFRPSESTDRKTQQYNTDQGNSNNVYSPRSPQSHKDTKQQNSQHLQVVESCKHDMRIIQVNWFKPLPSIVKLNTHGSALENPGKIGAGDSSEEEEEEDDDDDDEEQE